MSLWLKDLSTEEHEKKLAILEPVERIEAKVCICMSKEYDLKRKLNPHNNNDVDVKNLIISKILFFRFEFLKMNIQIFSGWIQKQKEFLVYHWTLSLENQFKIYYQTYKLKQTR